MRFEPIKCPTCGGSATGTLEVLTGVALFTDPDEAGQVDYAGETEVDWDTQRTLTDEFDRVTLVCSQGHEWQADELIDEDVEEVRS
jgi:hypothetical protein